MNWILSRINITMTGWLSEQFPSDCLWCGGDGRRDWLKIYVNAIEPSDSDTNSYNGNDDAGQSWTWEEVKLWISLPGSSFIISSIIFDSNTNTPWKTGGTASKKQPSEMMNVLSAGTVYVCASIYIPGAQQQEVTKTVAHVRSTARGHKKGSSESVTTEVLEDSRARVARSLKIKTFCCLVSGDKSLIRSVAVTEKTRIW